MQRISKIGTLVSWAIDRLGLPILLVILIGASYWLSTNSNSSLKDLGLNLMAGFVGSAVTIYAVDFLQKRRERRRLLPVMASVFEDIRLMTDRTLLFWKNAYQTSVGDGVPSSWADLISSANIQKVFDSLDIGRSPGIFADVLWRNYFCDQSNELHHAAEQVLIRHGMLLDPGIHNAVHRLVYYNYGTLIPSVEEADRRWGVLDRPPVLGMYVPNYSEYFDALLKLHQWTTSTYRALLRGGVAATVHEPYTYKFTSLPVVHHPEARYQWEEGATADSNVSVIRKADHAP
ncbi:hypothetical protein SBC1_14250 [Caballeronia sp. SBC1]|uniref:hypothetical protein n=1 Tax=unclassified Caballeronia TaxID=2646786 RepID=UPI0013E1BCEE|nr:MULTISPECIES: hypothetical protein [unclassified Caballeronia]QIE23538.1 hypothetical protein SBC2_15640 [Caballeronia sp. SBC2]QIN61433.1 hypothetical protein SBC1_14250 [Caballeronia sp. SBC1]